MSGSLQRARLLREHRRHEEAVAMLYEYLGQEPRDAQAHLELALNRLEMPGQKARALEDVNAAIGLEPDAGFLLALKASILARLDRAKEALPVADAAIAAEPESSFSWTAKAEVLGHLRRWSEAETAARRGLELDPDDPTASNMLAHFLRMQNKLDESESESKRRLERDPENAFSFATAGWSALQRGQPKAAEEHFREALRLDPESEHARVGLREAFKARSAPYRLYLKWCFFMQKHTQGRQWLIIIGIYLAFRFGREVLAAIHPLAAVPLVLAYLLFAFGGWLASGLGNFLLLTDKVARLSLNRRETLDGLATGGLFFGGLLLLVLGATVLPMSWAVLGAVMMGAAVPASLVFDNASKLGSLVFGAVAAVVLVCGVAASMSSAGPGDEDGILNETGGGLIAIAVIGVLGTTWLAMVPQLRTGREE